jgi:thioredoxin:protein disulfide reductase
MRKLLTLLFFLVISQAHAVQGDAPAPAVATENNNAEFLEPDQAFKLELSAINQQTLKASFKVAPGHYLYRQRISFKLKEGASASIASLNFPKGELKQDPNFGESEVYHHDLVVIGKLNYPGVVPEKLEVLASYQGCSEKGLCYAPIQKVLDVTISPATVKGGVNPSAPANASETGGDDDVNTLLKGGNLWLVVLGFFGFGLLLSLTPCVFPMIPILSGIIVGQGQKTTRMHAFNLSVAYTLGMAVSYTLAGIAAGLSGHLISSSLQNPWVLGSSAFIFVLLAFSMFGFYELKLPSAMESGVMNFTNRIKGGKFVSVFAMGILSALIVSPCVAAPLAGALLYIGQTHDVVLGGLALFFLSLGMGVPLLIVGASAGALLPRAGRWMETVRNFFGVLMLGMAIWLISSVISSTIQMLLWSVLLIISSIYLNALDALPENSTNWSKFCKGLGVITLLLGLSQFIGAMIGSQNPLQPFSAIQRAEAKQPLNELEFKRVKNVAELDAAIAAAQGKNVMLDFYADWCASCKEYERATFRDDTVKNRLSQVVLIQADVTKNTSEDSELLKRYGLFGPPGIIFFDKTGKEKQSNRVIGYQDAEKFISSLNRVI